MLHLTHSGGVWTLVAADHTLCAIQETLHPHQMMLSEIRTDFWRGRSYGGKA